MLRCTRLALVALLALTGAACGGDDDGGDDGATEDVTTDGGGADDGGDGGDDGDLAAGLLDEDCQFLLAGAYLNPLAAAVPGSDVDFDESQEQLQAIADEAPDEIEDAMETLAEGFAAMAEAFEDIDLSDPQAFADPDLQSELAELEEVFDDEYEAAGETVNDYIEESCSAAG